MTSVQEISLGFRTDDGLLELVFAKLSFTHAVIVKLKSPPVSLFVLNEISALKIHKKYDIKNEIVLCSFSVYVSFPFNLTMAKQEKLLL